MSLKNIIEQQYETSGSDVSMNTKEIAQKRCCTYDGDTSYLTTFNKWVDTKSVSNDKHGRQL